MTDAKWWLVCYDVRDPSRLRKPCRLKPRTAEFPLKYPGFRDYLIRVPVLIPGLEVGTMRAAGVWWHKVGWRSDVGPRNEKGRRQPVYFYHPNTERGRRAALAELREYLKQRDDQPKGMARVSSGLTALDVCNIFLADAERRLKAGALKPATIESYREALAHWIERVGNLPAKQIEAKHLVSLREEWAGRGSKPEYIKRIIRTIKTAWNWASTSDPESGREAILPVNTLGGVKAPRVPKRESEYATRADLARLFRVAWKWANKFTKRNDIFRCDRCILPEGAWLGEGGRCRRSHTQFAYLRRATVLMLRIAYHAGCRPGELCGATWADWRYPAWTDDRGRKWGLILLSEHKTEKTGEMRSIPVPPSCATAVERWRLAPAAAPEGRIFANRLGVWKTATLAEWLRDMRARAGLPNSLHLYTLRHTFHADARMGGVADALTGRLTGTSAKMIETRYGRHLSPAFWETAAKVAGKRRR